MTTPDIPADDAFQPLADGISARADVVTEGSNVCRAAALAALLRGATRATRALGAELREIGFSELVVTRSASDWRGQDILRHLPGPQWFPDSDLDQVRMRRWAETNETGDPRASVEFLLAMLGSSMERESAAAAAALWRGLNLAAQFPPRSATARRHIYDYLLFDSRYRDTVSPWLLQPPMLGEYPFAISDAERIQPWNSDGWLSTYQQLQSRRGQDPYVDSFLIATTVQARLAQALRSPDAVTVSLAVAALAPIYTGDNPPPPQQSVLPPSATHEAASVSTMIHGTWAWIGDWWRPKTGDFHGFIHEKYRPNLYSGGAYFSWSGAYRPRHRAEAAERFAEWTTDRAPQGIRTLFGHSYGGEIASRAANLGVPIQELVLLSAPVTSHVKKAAASGVEMADVRLPLDPVLALELKTQRIPHRRNVTRVITKWRLDHGATHEKSVWEQEDIAQRARIEIESDLVIGRT
ncbi:alpha/beta hydrolase [Mycobacteroides salmoniphilum]|uniref:alpha/beta hydrolase n=1 Tax=Mycobacteroides salmoniphilum TaxID=404941 RepID=UPI000D6A4907|nr:alpha/beta hydrolase [Mycobacteroides salmoniphilum]